MKILIISNMYPSKQKPYSGIFVKNQYEYIKKELNKDIEIYTMQRTFTSKIRSIVKYFNFYIYFTPYLFNKFDILHVHFFGYHVFLAYIYKIFNPKVKVIVTFHGSDTENIKKTIFKLVLKKIDTIISVGKEQSEYIYQTTKFQKIELLSAGISEKVFYKESGMKKIYDFIFVGSFYEVKGVDILIETIKELNNRNLKYCFVGSGKYLFAIKELQNTFNIIIKENQTQDEIRMLLNQSKWLVLPSRGDSFGLVVSEAMYCGTPVIVSNIGGMLDQVEHRENGFILKNNTIHELTIIINKCIFISQEAYNKLALNAEQSNKQYSMKNVCNKLNNIYKDLVNEN